MTTKIDQAFVSDFIDQLFGLPIAHENLNYVPTPGTPYFELRHFSNDISPLDLNDNNETTGFFQVTLRSPEDEGAIGAKLQADTVLAAYPVARVLTYDGQSVKIASQHRFSSAPDDGWYKIVLRINYWARIAR